MTIIRDGVTMNAMKVLSSGEAFTRAITEPEIGHISALDSAAFSWTSTLATGGTDVEVLTIRNDNESKVLVIEDINVSASAAGVFTIGNVTGGTPAGTPIVPICMNRSAVKTSQDTAFGNAAVTGSVTLGAMFFCSVGANVPCRVLPHGALILGNQDAIGISMSTSVTVHVTVTGYFVNVSDL